MIDTSIALGAGKILVVLALDAHHHQFVKAAPGFQDVHCLAVSVATSWTGETIANFLKRLITVTGRPAAYLATHLSRDSSGLCPEQWMVVRQVFHTLVYSSGR
jgi:hypothetical protein